MSLMHSLKPERAVTDILSYLNKKVLAAAKTVRKSDWRIELTKDLNKEQFSLCY